MKNGKIWFLGMAVIIIMFILITCDDGGNDSNILSVTGKSFSVTNAQLYEWSGNYGDYSTSIGDSTKYDGDYSADFSSEINNASFNITNGKLTMKFGSIKEIELYLLDEDLADWAGLNFSSVSDPSVNLAIMDDIVINYDEDFDIGTGLGLCSPTNLDKHVILYYVDKEVTIDSIGGTTLNLQVGWNPILYEDEDVIKKATPADYKDFIWIIFSW